MMDDVETTALSTTDNKALKNMSMLTREQVDLLKRTVAKESTDDEFSLFLQYCKSTGLNPFARQIFAIKRKDTLCIQTSIDGLRIVAERTGKYVGQTPTLWCGSNGVWRDIWLETLPPTAAKVGILRKDFKEPIYSIALWKEFHQETNKMFWSKMPSHMLAKCAEALALRKAFPMELSGVYSQDELGESSDFLPQQPPPKKSLTIDDTIPDPAPENFKPPEIPLQSASSPIPEKFLPAGLKDLKPSFIDLADQPEDYRFNTKAGKSENGHWLLTFFATTPQHPCQKIASDLLQKIQARQNAVELPTVDIPEPTTPTPEEENNDDDAQHEPD